MKLYHYTTQESYDQIIATGRINPSDPWTTMDASYGRGWYFTDLGPEYCDICIAMECWGDAGAVEKVECYLAYDANPVGVYQKCRAFVYIVAHWIASKMRYVGGGRKQPLRCPKHRGM